MLLLAAVIGGNAGSGGFGGVVLVPLSTPILLVPRETSLLLFFFNEGSPATFILLNCSIISMSFALGS